MEEMEVDEVVAEMDILLAPKREEGERLYFAQFPLCPNPAALRNSSRLKGRIRPLTHRVEIDVPIDTRAPTYDEHKGETLATSSSDPDQGKMEYQTFASSSANGFLGHSYAIARIVDGRVLMEPVDGCLQFRHSMGYLDAQPSKAPPKAADGDSSQDESDTESRAIQVRFSREGEGSRRRRAKEAERETEPWVALRFSPADTSALPDLCAQVARLDPRPPPALHHPSSVARTLIPAPKEETQDTGGMPSNVLSLAKLRKMPLEQQVSKLLLNAKVMPYGQLRSLLGIGESEEEKLLALLAASASLIRGVWVVNSALLYPEREEGSKASGPDPILMRNARDYILYRLQSDTWLQRKDMVAAVRLSSDHLSEVLSGVAKFRLSKGFTFPFPDDTHFIQTYPSVVEAERGKWERRWVELREWVRVNAEAAAAAPHPRQKRNSTRRQRTNSHRSISGDDPDGPKRGRQKSGDGTGAKRKLTENGSTAPEVGLDDAASADFQQFLFQRFSERPVLRAHEVGRLVQQRVLENSETSKGLSGLPQPLPPELFRRQAEAIGAVAVRVKEGEGALVFAGGGSWAEARAFLADFLTTKNRFRFKTLRDALHRTTMEPNQLPPDEDLKNILLDYCELKGGAYCLLGT